MEPFTLSIRNLCGTAAAGVLPNGDNSIMRTPAALLFAGALLFAAAPVAARDQAAPRPAATADPAHPVTENRVTATDVAATPVSDLNLRKTQIPALLIAAQDDPYSVSGLRRCGDISAAIAHLDAALGDDLDMHRATGSSMSPGSVAQEVVANFIPFRGVIRELSGANDQDRKMRDAVFAGGARRGFLKGLGLSRGCPYPARPAPAALVARQALAAPAHSARPAARVGPNRKVRYAAQPVVQGAH